MKTNSSDHRYASSKIDVNGASTWGGVGWNEGTTWKKIKKNSSPQTKEEQGTIQFTNFFKQPVKLVSISADNCNGSFTAMPIESDESAGFGESWQPIKYMYNEQVKS